MPAQDPQSHSTDVELLFDAYLEEVESGGAPDFEAFVARHPGHADELRELQADWERLSTHLDGALPGPLPDDESFAATIPVGPTVHVDAGDVVAGDYRLERLIGRGGMGQVWEAEQLSLRRRVALKLLRPGRGGRGEAARLLAEARAAGRLTHDGLVTVYAAGEADGVHYIAQQLVGAGDTLADVVNRRREEPGMSTEDYRRLAVFFADVAEAVHSAHEKGVLHRDIKPRNILIGADGRPKVGDFGLAHVAEDSRDAARPGLVGTYAYMSPEQVSERPDVEIDPRSDVFSLGVVFYEALTLRRAFEGDSARQILDRVRNADPPDPRRIRSHIPLDLAVICAKAMQKDREDRYDSMAALAADLRRFLANEPILAKAPGVVDRVDKWARRHPAKAMAALLGGAAVLAISFLLVREVDLRRQADENADSALESAALADERAAEALRQGYLANVLAASMHLDRGRHAEARRLLEACDVGSRGWEWRHFWLRADSSLLALGDHEGDVTAVAASADGRLLATAAADGHVDLWDGVEGRRRHRLAGHEGAVLAVALSDDGGVVVTGGVDGTVRAWDGATGASRGILAEHQGAVRAVALSGDGARVVSGAEDGTVRVLDAGAGLDLDLLPAGSLAVVSVALSRDGSSLVTGSRYGTVVVWDAGTGESFGNLTWHANDDATVAISGDGRRIVTGAEDGAVRLWDRDTGREIDVFRGHDFRVSAVAVDAGGGRVVSASAEDGRLCVWDTSTGALRAQLTGHGGRVAAVALSDDGTRVVAGSGVGARVWDGATRGAAIELPAGRAATSLAVSRDGAVLAIASTSEGRIRVWDGRTGAPRAEIVEQPYGLGPVAVSADGRRILSGGYDGTVRVWDGETGDLLRELEGHGQRVTSVASAGRGVLAVSGSHDGTVRVWDSVSGQVLSIDRAHDGVVTSVASSEDGRVVVSAGRDGRVRIHHADTGESLTLSPGAWNDDGVVACSADGGRVAWGSLRSPTLHVWRGDTGAPVVTLEAAGAGVVDLAMSPDGERLLGALAGGRDLHLWNATTGDTLAVLTGHRAPVWSVAMTRDGRRVASAGADGAVVLWETERETLRGLWQALD